MSQEKDRAMAFDALMPATVKLWHNARVRAIVYQVLLLCLVGIVFWYFYSNAAANIARRSLEVGFGFLNRTAGFAIGESVLSYSSRDTYARALATGATNTLMVAVIGCVVTTILGILLGILRLSPNPLVARTVGLYVELGRNIPLLLQLFFWYALITSLPGTRQAYAPMPGIVLSNRGLRLPTLEPNQALFFGIAFFTAALLGIYILNNFARRRQEATGIRPMVLPWALAMLVGLPVIGVLLSSTSLTVSMPELAGFNFRGGMQVSPELFALLLGLILYTTAFVTEIVRGGIQAVSKGQWEAGRALGMPDGRIMRLIILPQALRVIIPPLTSQYLNLTKNSSLAVAIGYPDLINISNTTINQTGQALEVIFIFMTIYLCLSLLISMGMNFLNSRITAR